MFDKLKNKILVLDGATGTEIQNYNLTEEDFKGEAFKNHKTFLKGCNEILNITNPSIIKDIHFKYMEAGADIIETNSFNANRISLGEYNLQEKAYEIAKKSAVLAKESTTKFFEKYKKKIFIAGSIGPTSKSLSIPVGNVPYERSLAFDDLKEIYYEQILGLVNGGIDIVLIETIFDGLNAKAALLAAEEVFAYKNINLPIMISMTVNKQGKLLSGQSMESLAVALDRKSIISFGLNCSFGAKDLIPLIKKLGKFVDKPISLYPNAGLPNEEGKYNETPQITVSYLRELIDGKHLNIVGGCCGTSFEHIKEIVSATKNKEPRKFNLEKKHNYILSGNEIYDFKGKFSPVGERNNVAGSKLFKRLIEEENYIKALEIARNQIKNGANILDINLDDGLLDSSLEMEKYLKVLQNDPLVSKYPLMIDSSEFKTIEIALKSTAGKSIINSISLKEGEEKFIEKALIIKKYGASVVAMAFDEKGQGVNFERKIEIIEREYKILKRLGFEDSEIIFDPNILTIGTGSESDRFNGVHYLNTIKWIRDNLGPVGIVGGLSNLSFAFRGNNSLRASIHKLFIDRAKKIGMNFAIMNPGEKAPALSEEEIRIIESLILGEENSLDDVLTLSLKKNEVKKPKVVLEDCESKIKQALIYGGSTTFQEDIAEALKKYSPLTIIQEILMSGMEEVGKMFEVGELYLPQLIRSATVMNNAIDILTPLLARNEKVTSKGKVVMATVAGDVHDIGKNIVGTVLKCNGFEIFDLGVMVSKDEIYKKAVEINADVVTLSGLISPSLKEMEKVLKLFNENNMNIPILVAGATTSKLHTALKLEPLYEKKVVHVTDALDTLSLVSKICGNTLEREKYLFEKNEELKKLSEAYYENKKMKKPVCEVREKYENKLKVPKNLGKFYLEIPIEKLEKHINWNFVLENLKVRKTKVERETLEEIREIFNVMKEKKVVAKATFGIFNCEKNLENDQVKILAQGQETKINFVKSSYKNTKVSLSDFLNEKDYIGAFLISVKSNIFQEKIYEKIIENLILMEAAESSSKYLQDYISERMWEINIRPAIGYNSIPDHSLKRVVFDILDSEKTDAILTETFSMYPLTSVCGFYFSSNDSFYF